MASFAVWLLQLVLMNSAEADYLISDGYNDRLQLCPSPYPDSPCETVFSGFYQPHHVEVVEGDYLVADFYNDRIQLCPAASPLTACTSVGAIGGTGSGPTQLSRPAAATVDADGFLIISDYANHRVQRCPFVAYSNDCITVAGMGELTNPRHTAIDAAGDYIISDHGNDRVVKCPATSPGSACTLMVTDLDGPVMVTITAQEEYLIVDQYNHRVLLCPSSPLPTCSVVAGTTGISGSGAGQLSFPSAVVVNDDGDFVVSDLANHRIQLCPTAFQGASCMTVAGDGTSGSSSTQLSHPFGIALVTATTTTSTTTTSTATTTTTNTTATTTTTTTTTSSLAVWLTGEWSGCSADCGQGTATRHVSCSLGTGFGCGLEERPAEEMLCEEDVGCGMELEAVFVVTGCILCFACLVGCVSCAWFLRFKWLRVNVQIGNVENPVSHEDFVVPGTVEAPEEVHVPPTHLAGLVYQCDVVVEPEEAECKGAPVSGETAVEESILSSDWDQFV